MYGHCIQTSRAFKVQFKLCQTAGSRGRNPFIPLRLLNDDPRDHADSSNHLLGVLWTHLASQLLRKRMSSLLSSASALPELAAHQLGRLAQLRWVMLICK